MHEHETDHDGRQICTTSGEAPSKVRADQTEPSGQHKSYIVLCEDERKKGFVRPYRDAYKHVGVLTPADHAFEPDTDTRSKTEGQCHICGHDGEDRNHRLSRVGGCGSVTTMGRALSETYARDPKFYGATFCCGCNRHLPVAEFVWTADGQEVGS